MEKVGRRAAQLQRLTSHQMILNIKWFFTFGRSNAFVGTVCFKDAGAGVIFKIAFEDLIPKESYG